MNILGLNVFLETYLEKFSFAHKRKNTSINIRDKRRDFTPDNKKIIREY
jgi:hypothetical protein